jgi:prepilin-type N-terminal cleavage/methylation domain-containing protein
MHYGNKKFGFTPTTRARTGFTLLELLVVVAIISLLSSAVLASLSGARKQAKITRMVEDFRQIETAFELYRTRVGGGGHIEETSFGTSYNPTIQEIIDASSQFKEALTTAPTPPLGNKPYGYDNDNADQPGDCGASDNAIFLNSPDIKTENIEKMDEIIDGTQDLNCGKLRYTGNIEYVLSGQ